MWLYAIGLGLGLAMIMDTSFVISSGGDVWAHCASLNIEGWSNIGASCPSYMTPYPNSNWIWLNSANAANNITFYKYFYVPGKVVNVAASVAADDYFTLYMNDVLTPCLATYNTYSNPMACDITQYVKTGINIMRIEMFNYAPGCGGLLFQVIVQNIV
jgi:hypothetical protein